MLRLSEAVDGASVKCPTCDAKRGEPCKWDCAIDNEPIYHLRRLMVAYKALSRTVWPLYIYLPQTRAWECHRSSTPAVRDELRAIWRSAGHATAVER